MSTPLRTLFDAVMSRDADAILAMLESSPSVDDQRLGHLEGADGIRRWVGESSVWLAGLKARVTQVSVTRSDRREVLELSLDIDTVDGVVDLPYVIVADRGSSGFTALRTYHSIWPYTGTHAVRRPPLGDVAPEAMPAIFTNYIDRVSVADVDAVLKSFVPEGYVREPSGNRWRHAGADRDAFYAHLKTAPRARFQLATSTVEGDRIAVEYGFAYGDAPIVGGICIMETRGDSITAVRITDDVGV